MAPREITMADWEAEQELSLARKAQLPREISMKEWEEMQKWESVDVPALALTTVTSFVKRRPVLAGTWVLGLLLAAFAGGLPVDDVAREAYSVMFQQAEVIDSRELGRSTAELQGLEERYYAARGWLGACEGECAKAFDRVQMARGEVDRLRQHRDEVLAHARQEVGIWSSFGVQDVRRSFWAAWKSGKDWAARMTMYNAIFMMVGREETFYSMMFRLVFQYVINLTMGLIGAFFFFVHNVYCLIVSYGSNVLSGLAFLLLAVVAGLSLISAYLGCLYGAVAGGGLMVLQQAARQAALEAGRAGGKARGNKVQDAPPSRRGPRCPV